MLVRLAFDALLDVFQAAVGRGPDGPGTLADYLSGPLGVQANDGAQQDGFCLVGGQGGDQAEGLLGGDGLDGAFLGVFAPRDEGEVFDGNQNGRRMKIGASQVVHGPVNTFPSAEDGRAVSTWVRSAGGSSERTVPVAAFGRVVRT